MEYSDGPGLGLDLETGGGGGGGGGGLSQSGRSLAPAPALGVIGVNGAESERWGTDQMVNSLFTPGNKCSVYG